MTTAQDQQSRAEFESVYRSEAFQAGIPDGSSKEVAFAAWQAARALPASIKPVGYLIDWPDEPDLGHYFAEGASTTGRSQPLHTAAQVLAMGRVPPGWQPVPVEPTEGMVEAGVEDLRLRGYKHALIVGTLEVWRAMLAAAPRPPAAQEVA